MTLPDAETLAWAEAAVGPLTVLSSHEHEHGESGVWRVRLSEGQTAFLKQNKRRGKWACEVHAYERWMGGETPTLLARDADLQTQLLTDAGGADAEQVNLSPKAEAELWHSAGAWLARLHALTNDWLGAPDTNGEPQGEASQDSAAFMEGSILSRIDYGRGHGLFDAERLAFIEAIRRDGTVALRGETARAVHRDFGPRNWRCDENGQLVAVFDFEHSRWDLRAADFTKVWDRELVERPDLQEAFFDGYGERPEGRLAAQIQVARLLGAVAGMVWSHQHYDAAYLVHNTRALERLMREA